MSSGFVSAGNADSPIERDAAWLVAQQELEALRRHKAEENGHADKRGLFETLQANKAAKQEAFEEAARLKNQFRALDADEVEFLDSVLQKTREEEKQIRLQTEEGLDAFRKLQEEADKKARELESAEIAEDDLQGNGVLFKKGKRKRRKEERGLKGVKIRRESSGAVVGEKGQGPNVEDDISGTKMKTVSESKPKDSEKPPAADVWTAPSAKGGLGLLDYGSDEYED